MAIYTSAFRIFSTVVSDPKYGDSTVGACTAVPPNTDLKFDTRLELSLKLSEGVELDLNGDGAGDGFWRYPIEQVRWIDSYVNAPRELFWSEGDAHSELVLVVSSAFLEDMTEESPWIVALTVNATFDRWNSDGSSTYFNFMLPPGASSNATVFSGPERSSTFWTAFRKCYEE